MNIIAGAGLCCVLGAGETKVHQLGDSGAAHQNVGEFQVAMRSSHLQRIFQTLADLVDTPSRLKWRQRLADVHEVAEISTFNELHGEIVKSSFVADVQNRDNIGMNKLLADSGFSLKTGHRPRIIDPTFAKQFESHDAVIIRRCSAENASKAAGCIAIQKLVSAEYQTFGFTLLNSTALKRGQELPSLKRLQNGIDRGRVGDLAGGRIPVRWGQQSRSQEK